MVVISLRRCYCGLPPRRTQWQIVCGRFPLHCSRRAAPIVHCAKSRFSAPEIVEESVAVGVGASASVKDAVAHSRASGCIGSVTTMVMAMIMREVNCLLPCKFQWCSSGRASDQLIAPLLRPCPLGTQELIDLAERMAWGVGVRDRYRRLRRYSSCFKGACPLLFPAFAARKHPHSAHHGSCRLNLMARPGNLQALCTQSQRDCVSAAVWPSFSVIVVGGLRQSSALQLSSFVLGRFIVGQSRVPIVVSSRMAVMSEIISTIIIDLSQLCWKGS